MSSLRLDTSGGRTQQSQDFEDTGHSLAPRLPREALSLLWASSREGFSVPVGLRHWGIWHGYSGPPSLGASSAPYNCLMLCLARFNFRDIHLLLTLYLPSPATTVVVHFQGKRIEVCNREGKSMKGVETKKGWEEYMGGGVHWKSASSCRLVREGEKLKAHWGTISEKEKHHGKTWVRSLWNLPVPLSPFTHWSSPPQRTMAAGGLSGLASGAGAVACTGVKNHREVLFSKRLSASVVYTNLAYQFTACCVQALQTLCWHRSHQCQKLFRNPVDQGL